MEGAARLAADDFVLIIEFVLKLSVSSLRSQLQ